MQNSRLEHRSTSRSPILSVVVVLLSAILAACGADTEGTDGAEGSDGGEATQAEGGGTEQQREVEYEWIMTSGSLEDQHIGQLLSFWAERVNERSRGGIEIEISWLGELVAQGEELAATGDGRADLMMATNLFHPAELPLSQVTSLPFTTYDGVAMVQALLDLYEEHEGFRSEHHANSVEFVGALPLDRAIVFNTGDSWNTIDDIKGKSVRAIGYVGRALEIAGADITALGTSEVYEALQRGAVEAGVIQLEGGQKFGWHEVAPTIQDIGLGQYLHMIIAINKDVWDGLSAEDQEALSGATQDMIAEIPEYFGEVDRGVCDTVLEKGATVSAWEQSEVDAFQETVGDSVDRAWIEETGSGAEEFLTRYRELLDQYQQDSGWVSGAAACAERSSNS